MDYDVAVIGGGVVGCATLFELTRQGYSCILLEKNQDIMSEASAGNSGMLHTGFDASLDSLEHHCIRSGHNSILGALRRFNIPRSKCGSMIVAWTGSQNKKLPAILENAYKAGVDDVHRISVSDLYKKEPFLRREATGALFVPGETMVDSNLLGLCYAHHAKMHGAKILTSCEVYGFKDRKLITSHGPVHAAVTINCAGLYGDKVNSLAGIDTFRIKPRKGQYCVFSRSTSSFLNSMIVPVPTEKTKGVILFNSVYNNLIIGPTAEDVPERMRPACDPLVHKSLSEKARWIIPRLNTLSPIGQYTGVRPATEFKDYQIQTYPQLGWITVGGIRSTGVSASLGIAQYVGEKLKSDVGLEPIRGASKEITQLQWEVAQDCSSVIIDGYHYKMSHPIFFFGQQTGDSRL